MIIMIEMGKEDNNGDRRWWSTWFSFWWWTAKFETNISFYLSSFAVDWEIIKCNDNGSISRDEKDLAKKKEEATETKWS